MKIGIISKEAHAKSHAHELRQLGHEVELLGGSPTELPQSLEAIVCRVASCSHGASALATEARREGRFVIFENSVTKILKAIELEGTAATPEKKKEEEVEPELDRTPVRGEYFRAYVDTRGGYWSVKTGRGWKTYVQSCRDREAAITAVQELDQEMKRRRAAAAEKKVVKRVRETDIGPMDVAGDYGNELSTPLVLPALPSPPALPEVQSIEDLKTALGMVVTEMEKLDMQSFFLGELGAKVTLSKVHASAPTGAACGVSGGRSTSDLGKVTCEACRNTTFYSTAVWVLANMKG